MSTNPAPRWVFSICDVLIYAQNDPNTHERPMRKNDHGGLSPTERLAKIPIENHDKFSLTKDGRVFLDYTKAATIEGLKLQMPKLKDVKIE